MSKKTEPKMFKPSLRDPKTLVILAVIALGIFIVAENARRDVRLPDYEVKLDAAKRMQAALETVKQTRFGTGQIPDEINDPNATAMIGRQESPITVEDGKLEDALTALNPNIAAAIVSYLLEASVKPGDPVAVGLSGSFPGLNLATICALEAVQAKPVIITSLGSAQWGANDPNFTWLDIENALYQAGRIKHRTVVASLGGGGDYGRGLSDKGRQLLRDAITRNNIEKLEVSSLDSSITLRMQRYERELGGKPKLYLAVGGSAADIGHQANTWLIPTGFFPNLPDRNYPNIGVLHHYAETGIPFIHLFDLRTITQTFELPKSPVPLPMPGKGGVYATERYDVRVAGVLLLIFIVIFAIVVNYDRKKYRLKEEGADPDTLPINK